MQRGNQQIAYSSIKKGKIDAMGKMNEGRSSCNPVQAGEFMNPASELAILVVAAGRGARAGGGIPKQYRNLAGQPLLSRTLDALMRAAPGAMVLPVIHQDDLDLYRASTTHFERSPASLVQCLAGPRGKQASIWAWRRFQRNNFFRQSY